MKCILNIFPGLGVMTITVDMTEAKHGRGGGMQIYNLMLESPVKQMLYCPSSLVYDYAKSIE